MRLLLPLLIAATAFAVQRPADVPPLLEEGARYEAPFQTGEQLEFEIRWKPPILPSIHAGDLAISLEDGDLEGLATWRIAARATSSPSLARFVTVDNFYESHIDRLDLSSRRLVMKSRQGERHRDLIVDTDYEGRLVKVLETDPKTTPPRQIRNDTLTDLPGPLSDIVSVFYAVRSRELEPGRTYLVHLNDRGRLREVPITVEKFEKIEIPIGTYRAVKLSTGSALLGNIAGFKIWYSRDDDRFPLKFQADAKLGHVSGKLIRLRTPKRIKTLVPTD